MVAAASLADLVTRPKMMSLTEILSPRLSPSLDGDWRAARLETVILWSSLRTPSSSASKII